MKYTRKATIDGKHVYVFDDLLRKQNLEALVKRFYNAAFTKNEIGRPDTAAIPHWACELSLDDLEKECFWHPAMQAVSSISDQQWQVYRAYVNYGGFGDTMFSHFDAVNTEELTCLWYIVPRWNIDWAGETIFYDSDDEAAFTCVPKPGRLVIFDATIKHSGRPPSRICYDSRFTLALKLERAC